jgi:phosphoglycerate dehydrogenase-like enzyme
LHSEAIAEHALALTLALRRGLHAAARRQGDRQWAQAEISEYGRPPFSKSTLLVVGLGTIGARVATWASALGMRVIGVRRRLDQPVPPGVADVLPASRLSDALKEADVVVLTVPGTRETRALIGAEQLKLMKPSAILVNIARGELIDEAALVRALSQHWIAAAGLDVFQEEPLPAQHPFWDRPDVLISPHTAVFAGDFWPPVVDLFLDNVERFKRGRPLMNPVDKRAGY